MSRLDRAQIPILNVRSLLEGRTSFGCETAAALGHACRDYGFFYVIDHGVDEDLQRQLEKASQQFFAQDTTTKLEIGMDRGGKAWRGYFPVGGEQTSGKPDLKEGIYFGAELTRDHPMVKAGIPLHGPNLFPANIPGFRQLVLDYMAAMTRLGCALMAGISLSLGLHETYFEDHYTSDPLTLFRIFNYPPATQIGRKPRGLGVGEHTDYGLLTILRQDMSGGLEVKTKWGWTEATPIPQSLVCNVGDMLDRLTRGLYLSAPHRVRNTANHHRLSFAFFFDPNFNADVRPIDTGTPLIDNKENRWDSASVHDFRGTYGDYLWGKVSKVFPDLHRNVL